MLQLQPPELLLHPANFRKVGFHVLIFRLVYLVGEIDKELRIALDGEALHPQGSCGLQARYQTFILRYVVGDLFTLLEIELYSVVKLVLSGRHQHRPSPCAVPGERPIKYITHPSGASLPGERDRSSSALRPGASVHSATKSANAAPLMTLVVLNSS